VTLVDVECGVISKYCSLYRLFWVNRVEVMIYLMSRRELANDI